MTVNGREITDSDIKTKFLFINNRAKNGLAEIDAESADDEEQKATEQENYKISRLRAQYIQDLPLEQQPNANEEYQNFVDELVKRQKSSGNKFSKSLLTKSV